jgi:hypothetical protein
MYAGSRTEVEVRWDGCCDVAFKPAPSPRARVRHPPGSVANSICFQVLCLCSEDSEVLAGRTIFRPREAIGLGSR